MATKEVYSIWKSMTSDHRCLRPKRWEEIVKVIETENIKSVLEFGSGVSTMLFDNLGLKVLSIETDGDYIDFVKHLCSSRVEFAQWDNKHIVLYDDYDLSLVDGILPRNRQLELALSHSRIIAVDDYQGRLKHLLSPMLKDLERIDSQETIMAIFKFV